jgi:hypothetical protein
MKAIISTFTMGTLLSALYAMVLGCSGNLDADEQGFGDETELGDDMPAAPMQDPQVSEAENDSDEALGGDMEASREGEEPVVDKIINNRGGVGAGATKDCCCPGTTNCTPCTSRQTCGWTGTGDSCTPECKATMHPALSSTLAPM